MSFKNACNQINVSFNFIFLKYSMMMMPLHKVRKIQTKGGLFPAGTVRTISMEKRGQTRPCDDEVMSTSWRASSYPVQDSEGTGQGPPREPTEEEQMFSLADFPSHFLEGVSQMSWGTERDGGTYNAANGPSLARTTAESLSVRSPFTWNPGCSTPPRLQVPVPTVPGRLRSLIIQKFPAFTVADTRAKYATVLGSTYLGKTCPRLEIKS